MREEENIIMGKGLINTPTGTIVGFCAIEKPSTKFDDLGVYSCQVEFLGDDAKAMKAVVDGLMADSLKVGTQVTRAAIPPYTIANKTITIKFKQRAVIKTKAGDKYNKIIKLFDATGQLIEKDIGLSAGSEVKIAFSTYSWAVPSLGCGVTLQPACIQVIKLVKFVDKDINPFEVEEGYQAAKKVTTNPFTTDVTVDTVDVTVDTVDADF